MAGRHLISRLSPLASLPRSSLIAASRSSSASSLIRLRPLAAVGDAIARRLIGTSANGLRCFSTRPTVSSLNDPSPNFSNRPPKETILLDGCDFEHWLVVVDPPEPHLTRDEIIDSYIKTLAQVVGSEDEARMKIYSVSTKHYFAFGALVSEELSYKIKTLPKVRWVLPDSYLDVKNKDYGGEPFIDGKAVPYDPKYHEEWVRNNARANERSRRNDRPRNSDRSRNFERRRENVQQNPNFQNRDAPPPMQTQTTYQNNPNVPPQNAGPPPPNFQSRNVPPMQNQGYQPPSSDFNRNVAPPQPNPAYPSQMPNPSYQGGGPNHQGYPGGPAPYPGTTNQGYQGGNPPVGGAPSYQGGAPPPYQGSYQGGNAGNPGYQGGNAPNYQPGGGYQAPNRPDYPAGGPGYQGRDVQGRDY